MIWLSSDLRFKWFWLSIDLRFNWFGCQLIWDSSDSALQLIWDSSGLVVNWSEIQVIWLSIDLRFKWVGCQLNLRFKWFGCQMMRDSNELVVNWFEIQVIWMSNDLRFKWFGCQLMCDSNDFVKRSFSARLPSKTKLWSSKTKHFCETSFKNEALKIKNEAFLRDFLKKASFEAQKRSFSARLLANVALQLKNEAFLRDFLQNGSFRDEKRSFSAGLPSKTKLWRSKTKHFCETFFKIDMLSRHLTSEFQYVLMIFKWMLQKYCACHEKVEPRHTKSCNCHATWSLQSNTSVTWNLQPFHGFSIANFKHRLPKARNPCACHAKRIVSDPLQIHHACQRFRNPHELLRLPRILQRVEIPAPATRNTLFQRQKTSRAPDVLTILTSKSLSRAGVVQILRSSTSKSAPKPSVFNDFDFQIVLARRRGANFVDVNFQKCSRHASF